ncbi:hypothetical protein GCM10028801_12700 [Nocardioides maradonensis]
MGITMCLPATLDPGDPPAEEGDGKQKQARRDPQPKVRPKALSTEVAPVACRSGRVCETWDSERLRP